MTQELSGQRKHFCPEWTQMCPFWPKLVGTGSTLIPFRIWSPQQILCFIPAWHSDTASDFSCVLQQLQEQSVAMLQKDGAATGNNNLHIHESVLSPWIPLHLTTASKNSLQIVQKGWGQGDIVPGTLNFYLSCPWAFSKILGLCQPFIQWVQRTPAGWTLVLRADMYLLLQQSIFPPVSACISSSALMEWHITDRGDTFAIPQASDAGRWPLQDSTV